LHAVINL